MSFLQNRSNPPFVLIYVKILRSPEFRRLSPAAQILWVHLRAQFNPNDPTCLNPATAEEQVYLPYNEIKKINGFHSSATISKTFKELIDAGWIKITEKGGLYRGRSAYTFIGPFKRFPFNSHRKKNILMRSRSYGINTLSSENESNK